MTRCTTSHSCLFPHYYSGDQVEKNKIGGACGTYGRRERCLQGFAAIWSKEITRKN